VRLCTIGFTKKTAETFFTRIRDNGVQCLVDIRLNPGGQLSGFAKQDDLAYFLRELAKCDYQHLDRLAPTPEILSSYRQDHRWDVYEQRFEALMDTRGVPDILNQAFFERQVCCLLCSEATPERCHRRLVAERLTRNWPTLEVVHLL